MSVFILPISKEICLTVMRQTRTRSWKAKIVGIRRTSYTPQLVALPVAQRIVGSVVNCHTGRTRTARTGLNLLFSILMLQANENSRRSRNYNYVRTRARPLPSHTPSPCGFLTAMQIPIVMWCAFFVGCVVAVSQGVDS
jgi:hypothetical protein